MNEFPWYAVALAVLVGGVAVGLFARRQWKRGAGMLATGLLLVGALYGQTRPVGTDPAAAEGTVVVYLGVTDRGYLERLNTLLGRRPTVIVGPPAARELVEEVCPGATFEAPQTDRDLRHGVTLGVAIDDLRHRLPLLRDGGRVYFVVPRTDNLAADRAALTSLLAAEPWLRPLLQPLSPGVGEARMWLPLPALSIDGPTLIDPDTKEYDSVLIAEARGATDALLHLTFSLAGDERPVTVQPATGSFTVGGAGGPVRLTPEVAFLRGSLPNPGRGRANGVAARLVTPYGETIAQVQLMTRCEPPEVPVLLPAGRSPEGSDLVKLLRDNNLSVRLIPVALPDTADKLHDPKFDQGNQFREAVEGLGVLLVDAALDETQGKGLNKYLTQCNVAPTLVFIGTDGHDAAPPGWAGFVGADTRPVTSRRVVLVKDMSGSMRDPADEKNPGRFQYRDPRTGQERNAARIDVANAIADRLYYGRDKPAPDPARPPVGGITQRNVKGTMLALGPADKRDGNGALVPWGQTLDEFEQNTTAEPQELTIGQYVAERNTDRHKWEFGPQLVAIRKLVEVNKEPISDVIAVLDAKDVRGYSRVPEPDNQLTTEQATAAVWLRENGVRIHTIGLGVALHPQVHQAVFGDVPGKTLVRGLQLLDIPDLPNLPALLDTVEKKVYENILPRLAVAAGDAGLGTVADKEKADALRTAAADPNLRLINVLFEYRAADAAAAKDVLVWANHHDPRKSGFRAPVFVRRGYPSYPGADGKPLKGTRDCYWLALDVRAELAAGATAGARQRNALADLLVGCVNAATASALQPAPVVWQVGPDGTLWVMRRDRRPLNLTRFEAKPPRGSVEIDTRQLTRPGFRFPGLAADAPEAVQVTVYDQDPKVLEQKVRLYLLGTPPLPLTGAADLALIGDAAAPAGPAAAGRPTPVRPGIMFGIVLTGWLAWFVMVWRK